MTNIERPKTLREKYTRELDSLYQKKYNLEQAATEIMIKGIASISLGNRSVSYTSLDMLQKTLDSINDKINELEAILSGRPIRSKQTNVYLSPSITIPRF